MNGNCVDSVIQPNLDQKSAPNKVQKSSNYASDDCGPRFENTTSAGNGYKTC